MLSGIEKIKSLGANRMLWAFPTTASILLIALSKFNLLGFHTLVEMITIVISFVVFALGWSTYKESKNTLLIFLACGYFWIGSLDLMHTFVFPGINIFAKGNENLSVQFWIVSRYLETLIFLAVPSSIVRKVSRYTLFIVFGTVSIALSSLILLGNFPSAFIEGKGLTEFKIYSEYLIVFMLTIAIVKIYRTDEHLEAEEIVLVILAALFTVFAELAFTLYDSLKGTFFGIAGHILKVYSFWFIFQAIIITNLRKPYTKIKQAEEKLSLHIRNTLLGCISWDENFVCTEWNKSAEKIFGFSAEEAIGKHPFGMIVSPKDRNEIDGLFNLLLQQKEGSQNTNKNITKDGKTIVCNWYNTPITNLAGGPGGITSLVQDISEQMETEKSLRQSQKMEAVGQLTGGVAHDFNNMLGIIMGNLELLRDKMQENNRATEYIDSALNAAERGVKINRKLLSFSRHTFGELRKTNVNEFIIGMKNLISKSLTPRITIETHLANDIWASNIDPTDFEDTLLNLSLNARDAMPDGGSLIIETTNKILDESYVRQNPDSSAGEHILVAVSDTGTGMSPEVRDKIFLPFFTTKEVGKGTGLGLSMVYGFIQRSGGHIKIYSEPGKGTTFHIFLPKSAEELSAEDVTRPLTHEELPRGNETILVVDDEEELLNVAVSYLKKLGYKTVTAMSSKQALEVLKKDHQINLLFSDVVMAGNMDGFGLGIEVLKKHTNVKVLLTSGFTANQQKATVADKPLKEELSKNILNKPYNLAELAKAVRQALSD